MLAVHEQRRLFLTLQLILLYPAVAVGLNVLLAVDIPVLKLLAFFYATAIVMSLTIVASNRLEARGVTSDRMRSLILPFAVVAGVVFTAPIAGIVMFAQPYWRSDWLDFRWVEFAGTSTLLFLSLALSWKIPPSTDHGVPSGEGMS